MKPSERRALLEKKRAEKEAEAQRRAEAAAYGDETNESVDYIKPIKPTASRYITFLGPKERAESEDKVEKKEGFFSALDIINPLKCYCHTMVISILAKNMHRHILSITNFLKTEHVTS